MDNILSSPAEASFTNASELALQAQENSMFYVGDTAPVAPKTGMVWVQINQANNNWLAWGTTTNQLKTATMSRGNRSLPDSEKVHGTPWVILSGTIMTLSCWLDLTGETITDIFIDGYAHGDSHGGDWRFIPNQTVPGAIQLVKAGTKGWITLTVKFPRDTELSHIDFYVYANNNVPQDVKIGYSSWKLDGDSKRTQWCDGINQNKGNVDNAQKWDGSKWVPTQFTSDVIADYIYGKNIIGSTFANYDSSFKVDSSGNIKGANITGSEFVTNSGGVHQTDGWMPWSWDSAKIDISNGFISTTANNAVSPTDRFKVNAVGTYSPTYVKFTDWSTDKNQELGRSYLDGGGLTVGVGRNSQSYVGPGSIQTTSIDIGNIEINGGHSYYSMDGKSIYFRPMDDHGGVNIHASGFDKISQLSTKTDITPMDTKLALNSLNSLELTKYKRFNKLNMGNIHEEYGGVIDDVNETPKYKFPKEFLSDNGDSEDDSNLLAFTIASVQELTKLNEQLQLRVALLEAQNGTNFNHTN